MHAYCGKSHLKRVRCGQYLCSECGAKWSVDYVSERINGKDVDRAIVKKDGIKQDEYVDAARKWMRRK